MILVILLYIICAAMFTASKWALAYTQPIFLVAVRMSAAGILLGGYCFIRAYIKQEKIVFNFKRDWKLLTQIIFFHIYLTYICDLCALKNISSVESAFLYNLSPFIAALFSYYYFAEYMTSKKWLGLAIGFLSLIPGIMQEIQPHALASSLTPKLITLAAVASSAYGWIILRALVKEFNYSPLFVNGFGMFFGGLLAFVTSYITESWTPSPVTDWMLFIQATVVIIVIANLVFYNLYGYLLRYYTATFLSFAGFICPLFAGLLGWIFLGEAIPGHLIFSFLMVSIGLFIFYQEELRQGYIIK